MYTLFVNLTKECNLDCIRCYLDEASRANSRILDVDTAVSFFANPHFRNKVSSIVMQGGELNLVNSKRISEICHVASEAHPEADIRFVTNLLGLKKTHVELMHVFCNSNVETTFAFDRKVVKGGTSSSYKEVFKKTAHEYHRLGVSISINFELNRESIDAGSAAFINYLADFPPSYWDFDISLDFPKFTQNPSFTSKITPCVPATVKYIEFWNYISELIDSRETLKSRGIEISYFQESVRQSNNQFGSGKLASFYTLNPDGSVTTNPLYSDIEHVFIGNVNSSLDIPCSATWIQLVSDEIERLRSCTSCERYRVCGGGNTYVPINDGSGECIGGRFARPYIESVVVQ